MDVETKAKLAHKLTHALHQAPNYPDVFVNIVRQVIGTAGFHITDLSITFGDLTNRMAERLRAARSDAPPTFDNLIDMAGTKIDLGKKSEKALARALGVTVVEVDDCRRRGRVPRAWFDKIRAMADLDETHAQMDDDMARVVRVLAEKGYTPTEIDTAFQRVRTSRAGLRQISKIVYGEEGQLDAKQETRMRRELFGEQPDADRRFRIWMATHLHVQPDQLNDTVHKLSAGQIEKLRERHKREIFLRQTAAPYRLVASAAELIERPLKASSRPGRVDLVAESRRLRSYLARLFGTHEQERHGIWLSQLTGLDERHTLDLLKGANGVGQIWWSFLDEVDKKVLPSEDAPLLRRMSDDQAAESGLEINRE